MKPITKLRNGKACLEKAALASRLLGRSCRLGASLAGGAQRTPGALRAPASSTADSGSEFVVGIEGAGEGHEKSQRRAGLRAELLTRRPPPKACGAGETPGVTDLREAQSASPRLAACRGQARCRGGAGANARVSPAADAVREIQKYDDVTEKVNLQNNPGAVEHFHMKLFRAQRNLYIAGFSLLLSL